MTRAAAGRDPAAWTGRRVLVAGAGMSGRAMVDVLRRLGADVTVADDAENEATAALEAAGVPVLRGLAAPPDGVDLVATSPGFRPTTPLLVAAAARGVAVVGEPELAWRLREPGDPPWLALTGTDGKTTTVRMLEAMLAADGRRTVAVGNIGVPLVSVVTGDTAYDVLAVELSSAQLHWSSTIRPLVGAVLNIARDHLDWTGGWEPYVATKVKIWQAEVGVANLDDPVTAAAFAVAAPGRRTGFTLRTPGPGEFGVVDGMLVQASAGADPVVLAAAASVRPEGSFNVANALAAAAMARSYGVAATSVRAGLAAYRPDPHRNDLVADRAGVRWIDNSKATNPHAALAALSVFRPVVWIGGGLNKGLGFDDLVTSVADRLRGAVLLGRCQDEIADALARHAPDLPVIRVARTDDGAMDEVVRAAATMAVPGDTVLLAPAAASMDMFRNYADRGEAFARAVRALPGGPDAGTAE